MAGCGLACWAAGRRCTTRHRRTGRSLADMEHSISTRHRNKRRGSNSNSNRRNNNSSGSRSLGSAFQDYLRLHLRCLLSLWHARRIHSANSTAHLVGSGGSATPLLRTRQARSRLIPLVQVACPDAAAPHPPHLPLSPRRGPSPSLLRRP